MSAPLSPEQRAALVEMANDEQIVIESHREGGPTWRRRTLRRDAIRAALAERTCGTCRHFWPWDRTAMAGTGDCHHHRFRGRMNGLADSFGCAAWTARPSQTETTP